MITVFLMLYNGVNIKGVLPIKYQLTDIWGFLAINDRGLGFGTRHPALT